MRAIYHAACPYCAYIDDTVLVLLIVCIAMLVITILGTGLHVLQYYYYYVLQYY